MADNDINNYRQLHCNMTALQVICILVKIATIYELVLLFQKLELYYVFYSNKKLFIDKNKEKDYQIIAELLIDVSSSIKYMVFYFFKKILKFINKIIKNCQELESEHLFKYLFQLQAVSAESLLSCHNFVWSHPFLCVLLTLDP